MDRLSSLLNAREAAVFRQLAERIRSRADNRSIGLPIDARQLIGPLELELKAALGWQNVHVTMKGSMCKGTQTHMSDFDFVVETPGHCVGLQDKLAVVEHLRTAALFHRSHVQLKRLAIQCVVMDAEVDIVFLCTDEYGQLPVDLEQRFEGNIPAQHAARMLKLAINETVSNRVPEKVPSYVLEGLVIKVQDQMGAPHELLDDGSMQLFCDAAQAIFDGSDGRILNEVQERLLNPASKGKVIAPSAHLSVREHLAELLNLLCASRFVTPGMAGFTNMLDMERWIRLFGSRCELEMEYFGKLPLWLFGGRTAAMQDEDALYGFLHLPCAMPTTREPEGRSFEDCKSVAMGNITAIHSFCRGRFGKYVRHVSLDAHEGPQLLNLRQQIIQLRQQSDGSSVAVRMATTREFWLQGEQAMAEKSWHKAIDLFARSARACMADDDPFSGAFIFTYDDEVGRVYEHAIRHVLENSPAGGEAAIDARLVRVLYLMCRLQHAACEAELTSLLRIAPNDHAIYHWRMVVRGFVGDWAGSLVDAERCIVLAPNDPCHYYWQAKGMMNTLNKDIAKQMALLRHFIACAAKDGRKMCQAWFDLALCLARKQYGSEAKKQEILDAIRHGLVAEQNMLPFLREHDSRTPDSDSKKLCLMFQSLIKAERSPADKVAFSTRLCRKMRESANKAFEQGQWEKAICMYTEAIDQFEQNSETHLLLSNRSAAFMKLREFRAAERDALAVIEMKPSWCKGFARLARVKLSQCDGAGALEAIRQAGSVCPAALYHLRDEAQVLVSNGAITPCQPEFLSVWDAVQFKESVVIVDLGGRGTFMSLREAVQSIVCPSTIILMEGAHSVRWNTARSPSQLTLQIIGEGKVELESEDSAPCAWIVLADGPRVSISLECLTLRNVPVSGTDPRHCAGAKRGATMRLLNCNLTASAACCSVDGEGSTLLMNSCTVLQYSGSGAVAEQRGFLSASECKFRGCRRIGVEVRHEGKCKLSRCNFSRLEHQAVQVHLGGLELEMEDCRIKKSGVLTSAGAVMVYCGRANLHGCIIEGNRGDGITLQDENAPPNELSFRMTSCMLKSNAGSGIRIFGSSASLCDNLIQENASGAIDITYCVDCQGRPIPFGTIALVRNVISGGSNEMIRVIAPSLEDLRRVTMDGNSAPAGAMFVQKCLSALDTIQDMINDNVSRENVLVALMSSSSTAIRLDPSTGDPYGNQEAWTDAMKQTQQAIPLNQDFAAISFNKKALIAAQERRIESCLASAGLSPVYSFMPGPGPANSNASPVSFGSLSKCGILQLVSSIGRKATGRILYGVLCTQPCRMKSIMTVLADEHGEAVFIAFYNVGATETEVWSRIFPKGLRIGIKEPFLKRFADASIGIRVENPEDIVYVSRVCASPKCRVAQVDGVIALLRCSKCKLSWYCSRACQLQDWGRHKLECRSTV